MPTNELTTTLIILAIVIVAIVRQVMPQKIRRVLFIFLPLIAAYEAYRFLPRPQIPITEIVEGLFIACAALVVGSIQALNTRVYYKNNQLYMQGGIVSLFAWVFLMFFRAFIGFVFQGPQFFTSFHDFEWMIWVALTVVFGSRSLILYFKHPEIANALSNEQTIKRKVV